MQLYRMVHSGSLHTRHKNIGLYLFCCSCYCCCYWPYIANCGIPFVCVQAFHKKKSSIQSTKFLQENNKNNRKSIVLPLEKCYHIIRRNAMKFHGAFRHFFFYRLPLYLLILIVLLLCVVFKFSLYPLYFVFLPPLCLFLPISTLLHFSLSLSRFLALPQSTSFYLFFVENSIFTV